jgi:hypothetical protein
MSDLYLIIGTQAKCLEWLAGTNSDADYTQYWKDGGRESVLTKHLDKGEITGLEGVVEAIPLLNYDDLSLSTGWLCFIVEATGSGAKTITRVHFGGVVTSLPRTTAAVADGDIIELVNVQASSFHLLANVLKVSLPPMVNQYADLVIKKIMRDFVPSDLIRQGTVNRPSERVSTIRFNNERRPWSACRAVADLFEDWVFEIVPVFESGFVGGEYHFREEIKTYASFTLSDDLRKALGPRNSIVGEDTSQQANIVTLPFFLEEPREPEFFTQVTTTNEAELNSKFALAGLPANAERTILYPGYFQTWKIDAELAENDVTNSSPPQDHTADEGYLVSGDINGITGLHFIDPATDHDWGQIALTSDPVSILFEAQRMTQLRAKELAVATLGDAIVSAYYDHTTISTLITSVTSASVFDVADASLFSVDGLVKVNDEERVIQGISSNTITLKAGLSEAPSVDDTCYLGEFDKSRVIFGLELKSDGSMAVIENGVSSAIVETYTTSTYTIRNLCHTYESWLTAETTTADLTLDDVTGFSVDDIVDVFHLGNNATPTQAKVTDVDGSVVTIDSVLGTIPENTRIRTKPKAKIQINGGAYGDVSGKTWTTLGTMANTIQTAKDTIREVGFAIALQKSLVGTLKEFKAALYPPIEVYIDGALMVTSTPDDDAEQDIDLFLVARNERYFLELPYDTKLKFGSGKEMEVRYNERRLQRLTSSDETSMEAVAESRGLTILSTDSYEAKARKGGIEADALPVLSYPISYDEARTVVGALLEELVKKKLRVVLTNLVSASHGVIEPGYYLTISGLSGVENQEIQIERVVATYLGKINGSPAWGYDIDVNVKQDLQAILRGVGNTPKKIIDESSDDSQYLLRET